MRILYVEDDPFDADLTRRAVLKTAPHFSLEIARNVKEALALLENAPAYDLLLTDLHLPDGTGMSLLASVRERQLPLAVVVITGQGDEEIAVSALKAGANDYLVKRKNYLDHLWLTLEAAYHRYQAETMRSERPVRVLYLENDPGDIESVRRHFAAHARHIHLEIVSTIPEVLAQLPDSPAEPECDALMLDYQQQEMNALDLLKELRQVRRVDVPIILVTSQGDEELAVQALRLGAYDYVVKSPGYLFRLPGLLENAHHRYRLTREQAALRLSEERFRRLAENAPDIIYRVRSLPSPVLEYVSPAIQTVTGFLPEELYHLSSFLYPLIHPEDWDTVKQAFTGERPDSSPVIFRLVRKDGEVIWVEARDTTLRNENGEPELHEGIVRDITERKQAEEHIRRQLLRLNALRSIDAAITANLSLSQTLNVILDHVIDQLGIDAAAILLCDPAGSLLSYRAGRGFRLPPGEQLRFAGGVGPAGMAAQERRVIRASSADLDPRNKSLAEFWRGEDFETCFSAPLVAKRQVLGVLDIYRRSPLDPDGEWLNFLETLAGQAAIAIDNAALLDGLQQVNRELLQAYDSTLEGWVHALDLRDKETEEHTRRVTEMTLQLARMMGVDEKEMIHIRRGALLHDIGKVGIPDGILLKPDTLTEGEWQVMHRHPEYAYQLLSGIDYLSQALDIPYYHHERWDGTGYPRGLQGEAIPLSARIFAIVDVWDALSSDRPYRDRWSKDKVFEYLRSQSGLHFDPHVVETFLKLIDG